jgi:hypothetical protein
MHRLNNRYFSLWQILPGVLAWLHTGHGPAAEHEGSIAPRSRLIEKISQGIPQRVVLYSTSLTAQGAWVPQIKARV